MNNQNLNCCGVYKIINTVNNKFYIGSAFNIKTRIRKHFELLKRNSHHSIHFQNAYNKYGKNVFIVCVLETCEKDNILSVEQSYLDKIIDWQYAYNISRNANGGGSSLSTHPNQIEIRKRMSVANKGKHTKPFYADNIRYETLQNAAEVYGVDIKAISYRIKNWSYKNYYYCDYPKIGKYDIEKNVLYWYKSKKENKKYYCGCGTEISKDSKYCKECRKLRKDERKYINPVIVNGKKYDSAKIASKIVGIEYATLIYRINTNTITFKNYYYFNKPKDVTKLITIEDINKKISNKNMGNKGQANKKPFTINNVRFETLGDASIKLNIRKNRIWSRLNNPNFIEYKYVD